MHYSTQHFCVRILMMPREVSSRQINRFLQATTCHRALLRRLNVAGDVYCASFVPMRRLFDGRMLFIQLQLCSCINSIQLVASPPHGITFLLRPVQCSRVRVPLLLLDASAERSVHYICFISASLASSSSVHFEYAGGSFFSARTDCHQRRLAALSPASFVGS